MTSFWMGVSGMVGLLFKYLIHRNLQNVKRSETNGDIKIFYIQNVYRIFPVYRFFPFALLVVLHSINIRVPNGSNIIFLGTGIARSAMSAAAEVAVET